MLLMGSLLAAPSSNPPKSVLQVRQVLGQIYRAPSNQPAAPWLEQWTPEGSFRDLDYKGEPGGRFDIPTHFSRLHTLAMAGGEENDTRFKAGLSYILTNGVVRRRSGESRYWRRLVMLEPGNFGATLALASATMGSNLAKDSLAFARACSGSPGSLSGTPLLEALWCRWFLAVTTGDDAVLERLKPDFEGLLRATWDGDRGGICVDGSFVRPGGVVDLGGDGLFWARALQVLLPCQEGTGYEWIPRVREGVQNYLKEGPVWASHYPLVRTVLSRNPLGEPGTPLTESGPRPEGRMTVYPVSDFLVKEESGWVSVLRMSSRRTRPFEWIRGEPDGIYHVGDGFWVTTAKGEDPRMSLWDPGRMPGTTVVRRPREMHGYSVRPEAPGSLLVGAVRAGNLGVSMQILESNDDSSPNDGLTARKAWFFFSNHTSLALGIGISSSVPGVVETIIDQRVVPALPPWVSGTNLTGAKALELGDMGYFFPKEGKLRVAGRTVSGSAVVNLWLDHGSNASNAAYAYGMVPGKGGLDGMADRFKILQQNAWGLAVQDRSTGETGYAFFGAGEVDELSASRGCAIFAQEQGSGRRQIWVCDPTQQKEDLLVRLRGYWRALELPSNGTLTKAPGGVVLRLPVTNGWTLSARLEERDSPF